jgi:signal transduction histidine kinase
VTRRLTAEIVQLISEATANAVRHGFANRLQVSAESVNGRLQLEIQDNGRGWTGPVQDLKEVGPKSLQNRVSDLGGSLTLRNSSKGVCLAIEIPLS